MLAGTPGGEHPLTHVADLPARDSQFAQWPSWADPDVVGALRASGIELPWTHQADAASHAAAGSHVVVATGTASGKSLAYQLPILTALAADPRATALYLSPTKALGADQIRSASGLCDAAESLADIYPNAFDGDTPAEVRQWVRANSRWVFTNPDMLHIGMLRAHQRWAHFFRNLRYVVVDECHSYRGVFGSNVALVLRRLRRICRRYAADPVFILASATTADPGVRRGPADRRPLRAGSPTARRTGRGPSPCGSPRCSRRSPARTARRCVARRAPRPPGSWRT